MIKVKVENLKKNFGSLEVLKNINPATVYRLEFFDGHIEEVEGSCLSEYHAELKQKRSFLLLYYMKKTSSDA